MMAPVTIAGLCGCQHVRLDGHGDLHDFKPLIRALQVKADTADGSGVSE